MSAKKKTCLLSNSNRDVLSMYADQFCFGIVFIANEILAQLAVKHLCEGTSASVSIKDANYTCSASPAPLRFLISTVVQIFLVCELTNLCGKTKTFATHPPSLISTHQHILSACQLTNLGQCQNICSHLVCPDQCHAVC